MNSPRIKSLVDYDVDRLGRELAAAGHKPMHAARILRLFHHANGQLPSNPSVFGQELQRHLDATYSARRSRILRRQNAADGTLKFLIGFDDQAAVESVLMPGFRA